MAHAAVSSDTRSQPISAPTKHRIACEWLSISCDSGVRQIEQCYRDRLTSFRWGLTIIYTDERSPVNTGKESDADCGDSICGADFAEQMALMRD